VIRILLADDHQLVREGLKQLLAAASDMTVAAEAAGGDAVLELLTRSMPESPGMDLVKRVKAERPKLRVLVLSMHGEHQYAARALKAGASGYLTKDSASGQLVSAIRKVAAGGVHISEAAAAQLLAGQGGEGDALPHTKLSDREFEVFRLIVAGQGLTEIGEKLHLSVKTVSTHKTRILEKMGVENTADLVRYAVQHGLT
jgi:DNA-binding NarL/FixJ family response regulator